MQTDTRPAHRLEDDEMATWLPLIRLVQLLPQALDRTLRDESGVNHAHYAILVTLAQGAPVTMGELARIAGLSRSRLSHAVDALEGRGWVRRLPGATDRRVQTAELTAEGRRMLRHAAPAHVAQIRALVLDRLTVDEREALASLLGKLLPAVDAAV